MDLKIEKGVPPPGRHINSGTTAHWNAMAEGDSIFFSDLKSVVNFQSTAFSAAQGTPFVSRRRQVEGGWRVWKVKREQKSNGAS
jgi:hypothetical protein